MVYIFMDESGCFGKGSQHFIITFLVTTRKKPLETVVKRTFAAMPARMRREHTGVLHCYQEQPKSRRYMLQRLAGISGILIMSIRIEKRTCDRLLSDQHALYNDMTGILIDRGITKGLIPADEPIQLIASQRETNTKYNANFCQHVCGHIQQQHGMTLNTAIRRPHQEKGLQVVDTVSWSLFRHYEYGDSIYCDMIRQIIVEDDIL